MECIDGRLGSDESEEISQRRSTSRKPNDPIAWRPMREMQEEQEEGMYLVTYLLPGLSLSLEV
jgi:hypothetical protein